MPHLSGVFEQFPDLDTVPLQNLFSWLHVKVTENELVNFLGNRILYPQTIAMNKSELEIDLSIIREGLKQKPALVFDPQQNKLFIPELFLQRFPHLARLAGVIIEAINPKGVIQVYLRNKKATLVGSLIRPLEKSKLVGAEKKIKIVVDGVEGSLNPNSLSISEITKGQIKIIIGNKEYVVPGGQLGVIIDLRSNN